MHNSQRGGGALTVITTIFLVAALVAVGILYGIEITQVNKANANIVELQANVTSLEAELTTDRITITSLQTQLTAAKSESTVSQAKVTSLTADLAAANTSLTATQASLTKATSDLTAAKAANTTLSAELTKVKSPRHFNSEEELKNWLAADDTNTNTAYSSLTLIAKAYILEVKAQRDGFLLPAQLYTVQLSDSSIGIAGYNLALVGTKIYSVNPMTDAYTAWDLSFNSALPSYPIPAS